MEIVLWKYYFLPFCISFVFSETLGTMFDLSVGGDFIAFCYFPF